VPERDVLQRGDHRGAHHRASPVRFRSERDCACAHRRRPFCPARNTSPRAARSAASAGSRSPAARCAAVTAMAAKKAAWRSRGSPGSKPARSRARASWRHAPRREGRHWQRCRPRGDGAGGDLAPRLEKAIAVAGELGIVAASFRPKVSARHGCRAAAMQRCPCARRPGASAPPAVVQIGDQESAACASCTARHVSSTSEEVIP